MILAESSIETMNEKESIQNPALYNFNLQSEDSLMDIDGENNRSFDIAQEQFNNITTEQGSISIRENNTQDIVIA